MQLWASNIVVLLFDFHSEYIKIIDGNGSIVLNYNGYMSSPRKTFVEVKYGNGKNITVEIYLIYRQSWFKLRYGIAKKGLLSGKLFIAFQTDRQRRKGT